MDPVVSVGYFKNAEAFISGNPDFPGERAGSYDSDQDNFIKGDGWDNFFRLRFNYLLPIGNGRDQIIATYKNKTAPIHTGLWYYAPALMRSASAIQGIDMHQLGSRAVAPPRSTAKRSSEMAPRISGRLRM